MLQKTEIFRKKISTKISKFLPKFYCDTNFQRNHYLTTS